MHLKEHQRMELEESSKPHTNRSTNNCPGWLPTLLMKPETS